MPEWAVNPLFLFLAVWSIATGLYLGGVRAGTFPLPEFRALEAFILNIVTFSLGYLTWSLFQNLPLAGRGERLLPQPKAAESHGCRLLTRKRLVRGLKFALLMGMVALLMELYRISTMASYFDTTWSYLVSHPAVLRLRLVMFISGSISQTSLTVMVLSLTNSIFSIGFVLLGVFLYFDRTCWGYVYLFAFLFLSLTNGLLHLSRYEVTANILYMVLAYCFLHAQGSRLGWARTGFTHPQEPMDRGTHPARLRLVAPIAAIALLFLAIEILLQKSSEYSQASRLQGFAFHLYWYLASPLAAFNEFLRTFSGPSELGQNTFFPLYKWLCRLNLAPQTEYSIYGEKVLIPYMANTYTYLQNLYADFGILGVALAPYILGWLIAAIQQRACQCVHFLNLYLILLMFILFSSYNFFLCSNQNYLQILFGFLFFRYEFSDSSDARA